MSKYETGINPDDDFAFEIQPRKSDTGEKIWREIGLKIGDKIEINGQKGTFELVRINKEREPFIDLVFRGSEDGVETPFTIGNLRGDQSVWKKIE
jgi:hypothetical protein